MENKVKIATTIRWIARIWGSLVIVFVVLMFGVELFEHLSGTPKYFINSEPAKGFEIIGILVTPIMLIIGLIIAFKWDGLGGLIIIVAMTADMIDSGQGMGGLALHGLLTAPGLLFLIYWFLSRGQKET